MVFRAHWQRVSTTFWTRKNSTVFLVLLTGIEPSTFGSPVWRSNHWTNPSPNNTSNSHYHYFIHYFWLGIGTQKCVQNRQTDKQSTTEVISGWTENRQFIITRHTMVHWYNFSPSIKTMVFQFTDYFQHRFIFTHSHPKYRTWLSIWEILSLRTL